MCTLLRFDYLIRGMQRWENRLDWLELNQTKYKQLENRSKWKLKKKFKKKISNVGSFVYILQVHPITSFLYVCYIKIMTSKSLKGVAIEPIGVWFIID